MVNIVLILIVLKAQILSGKCWKYHFQASKFQNFLGGRRACPQTHLGSLRSWRLKSCLPPTFSVGTSTSKLIDSTEYIQDLTHYIFLKFWIVRYRSKLVNCTSTVSMAAECSHQTPWLIMRWILQDVLWPLNFQTGCKSNFVCIALYLCW